MEPAVLDDHLPIHGHERGIVRFRPEHPDASGGWLEITADTVAVEITFIGQNQFRPVLAHQRCMEDCRKVLAEIPIELGHEE
jgi:hypothetical protein